MPPLKIISGFLIRALIYYALLMAAWPYVDAPYRACFRAVGNGFFSARTGAAAVKFEPFEGGDRHRDTQLVLQKLRPFVSGRTEIASGLLGYRPAAFLVALVLATPIPWPRRLRALLLGLLLVNLFVLFRVGLRLFDAFSDANVLNIYDLGPFWKNMLRGAVTIVVRAPVPSYIIPAFIWMLASFRSGDLQMLLNPSSRASAKSAATPGKKRK